MKQALPLPVVADASGTHASAGDAFLDALNAALDTLTDPEIPVVTLREMGILRAVRQDASGQVEVVITPTYSGCPAMDTIADDIEAVLADQGVAGHVVTQLSPAWTTDWMNDTAREKLRAYGIAPPQPWAAGGCTFAGLHQRGAHASTRRKAPAIHYDDGTGVCCPRCHSSNTQEISRFGSTACKALYRCLDCAEPFDYFKAI